MTTKPLLLLADASDASSSSILTSSLTQPVAEGDLALGDVPPLPRSTSPRNTYRNACVPNALGRQDDWPYWLAVAGYAGEPVEPGWLARSLSIEYMEYTGHSSGSEYLDPDPPDAEIGFTCRNRNPYSDREGSIRKP